MPARAVSRLLSAWRLTPSKRAASTTPSPCGAKHCCLTTKPGCGGSLRVLNKNKWNSYRLEGSSVKRRLSTRVWLGVVRVDRERSHGAAAEPWWLSFRSRLATMGLPSSDRESLARRPRGVLPAKIPLGGDQRPVFSPAVERKFLSPSHLWRRGPAAVEAACWPVNLPAGRFSPRGAEGAGDGAARAYGGTGERAGPTGGGPCCRTSASRRCRPGPADISLSVARANSSRAAARAAGSRPWLAARAAPWRTGAVCSKSRN